MSTMNDAIEQRKEVLMTIKTEIIQRLNIQRDEAQIDDDTALFGNGFKLDSVDATEIVVLLDKVLISRSAKVTTRPICAVSIVWPPSLFKRKTINYLLKN